MSRPDLSNLASRLVRKSPAARGIWKHTLAQLPTGRTAATVPNLIIAGAQKCGTTSLHNYLAAHPDIFMPHHKEPGFFLDLDDREVENTTRNRLRYDLDDARLLRLMAFGYRGEPWFGDSSTYYSMHPFMGSEAAANIADRSPDARVIYIVRHPLERMVSQYLWGERNRFALGSFRDVLDARLDVYLAISSYATQARHLLTHIDAERVLFLKSDELFRTPSVVVDRALDFLGLDRLIDEATTFGRFYESGNRRAHAPGELLYPPDVLDRIVPVISREIEEFEGISGLDLSDWDLSPERWGDHAA